MAWVENIRRNTGITVPFPIVADQNATVARKYGMISPAASTTVTVRNVYFIDPNGIIRAILIYPLTNGRNIVEILRLLDALQTTDMYKVATPADWLPGQPVIQPAPTTFPQLLERQSDPKGLMCMDWYLCFKNLPQQGETNQTTCCDDKPSQSDKC